MPRPPRAAVGWEIYHVLNRANARMRIFGRASDYIAFERILVEGNKRFLMRMLAYCLMPNHWHLVLWPRRDGDLSSYMAWTTMTHAQRWHAYMGNVGTGHLYQGRYKSAIVQDDLHLVTLLRYVEGNPLRAGLVRKAEDWQWGSLWRSANRKGMIGLEKEWPIERPAAWTDLVNSLQDNNDLGGIRTSIQRGQPFGSEKWQVGTAKRLGLLSTIRARGRPRTRRKGS